MIDYWELSEKQRASLTSREVENFIAAELMRKGVLRVEPLVLVDEPTMPEPDLRLFALAMPSKYGGVLPGDIAFDESEQADAARKGAWMMQTEYIGGSSVHLAHRVASIEIVSAYSSAHLTRARGSIEQSSAARAENKRREEAHEKGTVEQKKATDGLWDDWHRCGALANEMARIEATFASYIETANGDRGVATKFLTKVFSQQQITDASEWTGVDMRDDAPPECVSRIESPMGEDVAF